MAQGHEPGALYDTSSGMKEVLGVAYVDVYIHVDLDAGVTIHGRGGP